MLHMACSTGEGKYSEEPGDFSRRTVYVITAYCLPPSPSLLSLCLCVSSSLRESICSTPRGAMNPPPSKGPFNAPAVIRPTAAAVADYPERGSGVRQIARSVAVYGPFLLPGLPADQADLRLEVTEETDERATAVGWTPPTVFSNREGSERSGPSRIPPSRRGFNALRPPAKRALRTPDTSQISAKA
jgi:hypothetical protein